MDQDEKDSLNVQALQALAVLRNTLNANQKAAGHELASITMSLQQIALIEVMVTSKMKAFQLVE